MGFRFRKSVRIGKGFRVNFSKGGVGFSAGIPGTGLSWGTSPRPRKDGPKAAVSCGGCLGYIAIGMVILFFIGILSGPPRPSSSPGLPPLRPGPAPAAPRPAPPPARPPAAVAESGLTLAARRQIYADTYEAEMLANFEADHLVPLDGPTASAREARTRFEAHERVFKEAYDRNYSALAKKHGIDVEMAAEIAREGIRLKWPAPETPNPYK
jgi:hypothetical protein